MHSRSIEIQSFDGKPFHAYLSLPPTGSGPGIVLIQEIFGVNSHIRAVADQYAMDGYVVLAPDVFWRIEPGLDIGYGPEDVARGMEMKKKLDLTLATKDLGSVVEALRSLPECNGKVASLGYCMGGLLSYLCAVHAKVDAAVSYYPGGIEQAMDTAPQAACPILFHFAGKDRMIPETAVQAVRNAFAGNERVRIEVHPEVDHGFNCWARGAYNQKAAALAHGKTLSFLAGTL